jgi:hypothetical protein
VDLRGFGSFSVKEKKERQGRNPRTGETITIAAKRDASFTPGKELTEKLILPKTGSGRESEKSMISRCFPQDEEFGFQGGQPLGFL